MGFMDEYYKALKDDSAKSSSGRSSGGSSGGSSSFMDEYYKAGGTAPSAKKNSVLTRDIAPISDSVFTRMTVRRNKEEEKKKKRKWFEKGLFEDGYDIGDITRTILGTTTDVLENVGSGIIGMGEKAVDAMAYIAPYAANGQFYQNGGIYTLEQQEQQEKVIEESKKEMGKFIAKDLYDEEKVARAIISDPARKIGIDSETQSVFGEKSDALIQSGGQLLATAGLQAVGVPWFVTTGVTSYGSEVENAMNQDASYEAAGASAAISAGAEILSEKLSGGISFGGKTLDDALTKQLARGISNKLGRTAAKLGLDMAGEGAEEVFSQIASNLGSSLYKEEDITELLFNEEAMDGYLESFIGGAALGGVAGSYNAVKSGSKGVDYASGLTQNEQKVVDKLYQDEIASREKEGKISQKEKSKIYDSILEDMEKGYISTDTIEEVLGGEKYSQYKQTAEWENSLQTEFDQLNKMKQGDMTGEQVDRREALRNQIKNVKATSTLDQQKNQIRDEVMSLVKGDRLAESYNQRYQSGQKYQADVTQYDAEQQTVVQKAIDSGILNNTRRTHEFVDFVSKISADTGVLFDFSNTQKIREAGFAVEGQTVDGFITKDGITVNIDSPKSRQFVVGHEITHALEGTELYDALRQSVFDYAKMKNQYGVRMESIQKRYKEGTDFEAELTADLVGEYIFSDTDFINNLSTQNRNVFQKVYDEIKYLYKVATAGSKEARELERVKRAFEKVYREGGKTQGETKYSVSDSAGKELTAEQQEYFKDSKARDENGNLVKVYHSSPTAGFTVFDGGEGHGNYKFGEFSDSVTFFTDNKAMADSYSPSDEKVDTKKLINLSDAREWLGDISAGYVEIRDNNGKFEVFDSDEDYAILEYDSEEELLRNLKRDMQEELGDPNAGGQYEGYVNLKNPLIVDAQGRPWNRVTDEFSQEVYDKIQSLTEEEKAALIDLAEWEDFSLFRKEISDGADLYEMGRENDHTRIMASITAKMFDTEPFIDLYQLFDVAADAFAAETVKEKSTIQLSTNDYVERALQDGSYDGVIIKNVIDYGGHAHSTLNSPPGNDYIVFNSNQFKAADNLKPTEDADIRFSLSNPVEETKDLVALHNLTADKLMKSLELGGLPMPSLAITKADIPHSNFGDITLVFGRETIDPKKNKKNKVYSADAWTPTFPRVEYEADSKVANRVSQRLRELEGKIDDHFQRDLRRVSHGFEDYLNSQGGEEGLIQRVMDNYGMKAAYLEDTGKHIEKVTMLEEAKKDYNPDAADKYMKILDILGVSTAEEVGKYNLKEARDNHGEELEAVYPGVTKSAMRMSRIFSAVMSYLENKDSGPVYNKVTDSNATQKAVDDALDAEGYEAWVRNLFSGIVKDSGIYNNKEYYTPSGNRRTFKQTHLPFTLENIVKAMVTQNDGNAKNVSGFNGIKTLRAATAETFKSVAEMHQRKGRLQNRTQEEADALNDALQSRLFKVMEAIDNESGQSGERNPYIRLDTIGEIIAEIGEGGKYSVADIQGTFKQYGKNISDDTALDVKQLLYDVTQMPVNIFEAKPQRVVSFDEAKVFVIPNNADTKLKQELLNRGYSVAEYDPDVEGDRQRVVNQFEDLRFSLSNVGGQHTSDSLSALRYDAPVAENATTTPTVAPVKETLTTEQPTLTTDVAEAPVTADDMASLFPNDAVPVQAELEQLISERDEIYGALEIAVDRGSAAEVGKLAEEYEALNARIKALESEDSERIGSLTDAPPEMDAPFYGESEDAPVDDPFEDRDWYKVGNQKVKAYMYENPEVKPFFQAEAQNLLGELSDTQKGERWYNDDLYYESGGEQGFGGQKRLTSDSIATLLDDWGMSYADIEKGLNAIIEDNGAENIAAAKKIEFMLNDRLLNGYKDFYTNGRIEPNQDYINLLNVKQINSYSKEAFDSFMANADQYAPFAEDVAPVKQTAPDTIDAPIYDDNGQSAMFAPVQEEQRSTRKEYHQGIIDSIKSMFKGRGFDFDKVLKNAKNLSTWSTVDNTPQRVMEKALGYKEGGILADMTVNKVAQNETEGIKWLNSYVKQLKQISKQYGIKPGSKESAAAQMFAEGFFVNENNEIIRYGEPELIQDFGDADVRRRIKGLARDPRIRKIYDDTLANINESRARNLYPEIPRLDNYFLHFRAMEDTFSTLGLPFNPNDIRAKDLPTDLNGVTADLKPGQPFFSSAMHRTGKRTSFDLLGGVERYLNSAKNQIYHIDDIQTLRALRNYIAETYGQANGLKDIDSMSDAEAEERIKEVYNSHLSTFAKFLNEEANVLAGKTALIDRGIEGLFGRKAMTFMNTLNRQVGSNMVGYNVSSSLTNFLPVAQTFAKTNKFDFTKAFAQTVANKLSGGRFDSFAEDSPVVIRRKGEDRFYRTPWQKMADPGYALMGMVDDISTEIIARTKYNEFIRKGMDSQKAHFETDKWVSKLMGDRSLGQQPQLYNSKMLGLVTKFQLEVRNQLDSQFYDTIQETKASNEHIQNGLARNAKTAAKVASVFTQLAVAQHLYGMAFESMAGYNPAFDIIEVLMTAFGFDDEEDSEDTALDNFTQGLLALAEDMPYSSLFLEGGRIPIASAIPDVPAVMRGEDKYGNEIGWKKALVEEFDAVAPYYLLPGGGGQIKKTVAGLKMFSDDHPIAGSYTDAGNLRYDVEDTVGSRIKAGIFGQYASENAQKYFDQEQRTLNPEQTEIFAGLNIPIEEYWEYRDNLYAFYDVRDALKDAAYADDATDEDVLRYTYINNIYGDIYDLYDKQKELASGTSRGKTLELRQIQKQMEQMLSESKFGVDSMKLTGAYAEVGGVRYNKDADSGRWYEINPKNADGSDNWYYQKEQEVTKGLGISYEEYWNNREEYNYAYDKPGKYAIAKAVGGFDSYMEHYDVLENWQSDNYLGADKDSKGNSISGSRKKKVIDYINGLDADYGEKIILYRTVYTSKADKRAYNQEIIDYLNERDDISYQQMKTILEELDMEVDSNGNITW